MKELIKLAAAIPSWPWPKVSCLLALGLLYKGKVNFEEAVVLTLLAIIVDSIGRHGISVPHGPPKGKIVSKLKRGRSSTGGASAKQTLP